MRLAVVLLVCASSPAAADYREPPVHLELGVNARRFQSDEPGRVAFRTVDGSAPEQIPGSGITMSLRFTKWMRYSTFAGFEAETGTLSAPNTNVAAAYGVVGARGTAGPVALRVELAPGKRWIRYEMGGKTYQTYLAEARVRAETWISARFTLGGAIGATVTGDANVWMAGVYIGVHSLDYGTR